MSSQPPAKDCGVMGTCDSALAPPARAPRAPRRSGYALAPGNTPGHVDVVVRGAPGEPHAFLRVVGKGLVAGTPRRPLAPVFAPALCPSVELQDGSRVDELAGRRVCGHRCGWALLGSCGELSEDVRRFIEEYNSSVGVTTVW